jgi:hypothetical protein
MSVNILNHCGVNSDASYMIPSQLFSESLDHFCISYKGGQFDIVLAMKVYWRVEV